MELSKKSVSVLKEFAPQIESVKKSTILWIIFFFIIVAIGIYALIVQIVEGHIVTGMRDHVVWGLFEANFIFFIGISYAGAILSGILHLLKVKWRHPIIRIAQMTTVIATVIGPVYILLCVGRLDRLHHLILYPRLQSPITWDFFAIGTFFVASLLFLYLALIKDFAIYRDSPDLNVAPWRKRLYKTLALGYEGTPSQKKKLALSNNLIAIIIIPLSIIVHSVLSWIFGMTLRPGWHSTIFGPYFVLAAIYSGTGVIIVGMWAYRKVYKLQKYITDKHFRYMGYILLVLAAGYGYFTFSEYLTSWYGSEKWDMAVLDKLFSLSEYGGWFLFSNIAGILVPIIIIAVPKWRTPNLITFASGLMVLALWVRRYLIVIPTLETPLIPMQETRPEYIHYTATWVEWALTLGGVATFFLFFILVSKFVTIVPISGTSEEFVPLAGIEPESQPQTSVKI